MKKSVVIVVILLIIAIGGLFWASRPSPKLGITSETEFAENQPPVPPSGVPTEVVEFSKAQEKEVLSVHASEGVTVTMAFTPNFNTENPQIAPAPTNSASNTESNNQSR